LDARTFDRKLLTMFIMIGSIPCYLALCLSAPLSTTYLRTPAARYAEANLLMDRHDYTAAAALITALPVEHELRGPDVAEQQRMLQWIAFRETLHNSNRTLAELDSSEVDQLETLIGDAQDRPAVWIANALCFHYERCRPVHTGGESGPKSLPYTPRRKAPTLPAATLSLKPNPAQAWVAISWQISDGPSPAAIELRDMLGRPVDRITTSGNAGQVVWDCRAVTPGTYTATLLGTAGDQLAVERVIVQQ
jgi:hypothetical protein